MRCGAVVLSKYLNIYVILVPVMSLGVTVRVESSGVYWCIL